MKKFADIKQENGDFLIGNDENGYAKIIATDIFASNGVIHVIDVVLLPPASGKMMHDDKDDEYDEDEDDEEDQDDDEDD